MTDETREVETSEDQNEGYVQDDGPPPTLNEQLGYHPYASRSARVDVEQEASEEPAAELVEVPEPETAAPTEMATLRPVMRKIPVDPPSSDSVDDETVEDDYEDVDEDDYEDVDEDDCGDPVSSSPLKPLGTVRTRRAKGAQRNAGLQIDMNGIYTPVQNPDYDDCIETMDVLPTIDLGLFLGSTAADADTQPTMLAGKHARGPGPRTMAQLKSTARYCHEHHRNDIQRIQKTLMVSRSDHESFLQWIRSNAGRSDLAAVGFSKGIMRERVINTRGLAVLITWKDPDYANISYNLWLISHSRTGLQKLRARVANDFGRHVQYVRENGIDLWIRVMALSGVKCATIVGGLGLTAQLFISALTTPSSSAGFDFQRVMSEDVVEILLGEHIGDMAQTNPTKLDGYLESLVINNIMTGFGSRGRFCNSGVKYYNQRDSSARRRIAVYTVNRALLQPYPNDSQLQLIGGGDHSDPAGELEHEQLLSDCRWRNLPDSRNDTEYPELRRILPNSVIHLSEEEAHDVASGDTTVSEIQPLFAKMAEDAVALAGFMPGSKGGVFQPGRELPVLIDLKISANTDALPVAVIREVRNISTMALHALGFNYVTSTMSNTPTDSRSGITIELEVDLSALDYIDAGIDAMGRAKLQVVAANKHIDNGEWKRSTMRTNNRLKKVAEAFETCGIRLIEEQDPPIIRAVMSYNWTSNFGQSGNRYAADRPRQGKKQKKPRADQNDHREQQQQPPDSQAREERPEAPEPHRFLRGGDY